MQGMSQDRSRCFIREGVDALNEPSFITLTVSLKTALLHVKSISMVSGYSQII